MRSLIIAALAVSSLGAFAKSNDPFSHLQWGLENRGEPQTIELDHITTFKVQGRSGEDIQLGAPKLTSKKIKVAVLDTGVDKTHPDLASVIHRNESECKALAKFEACVADGDRKTCEAKWMDLKNPEVDLDKNGYPLDCSGWSILGSINSANILGRPDFGDDQGHGTHVAGIIAASRNNGLGVAGVSGNVSIIPVQVLGNKPSEPLKPLSVDITPGEAGKEGYRKNLGDLVARGVIYAIRSGAQVINFSMGWPESSDSAYLRQVIEEAQKRGIIVVAAAGNDSTRALLRPCAYPNVICVAASAPDGSISHFSNYGTGVDVSAPGTNILSTYPMERRPIRFRSTIGYDYLHGTSQASPIVAGVVAEMLAQGVPSSEIRARLLLSARQLLPKLPLLEGVAHDLRSDTSVESTLVEKKWLLSGQASLQKALELKAQPLIVPASKERKELSWNRKDKTLKFSFPFTNLWAPLSSAQVKFNVEFLRPNSEAIRPMIKSIKLVGGGATWNTSETRELEIIAEIVDSKDAFSSRIPSELDFIVTVEQPNLTRKYVLESELVVPVATDIKDADVEVIALKNMPQMRTALISIDDNLDGRSDTDYVAFANEDGTHRYFLMKQGSNGDYDQSGELKVRLGEDSERSRDQIMARLKNLQGQTEYRIGLFIDRSDVENGISEMKIHRLDQSFKKLGTYSIKNDKVQVPLKVHWQKLGTTLVPSWVGKGHDPAKKPSLRDDWENPGGFERAAIRFYYMNEEGKLGALSEHEGYRFIDIIDPSLAQIHAGRVPVILAKNRGTQNKPSYIYDFAVAEVSDGKVLNFRPLAMSLDQRVYRNLLDTRVDQVLNLDFSNDKGRGTFWFGEGPERSQRLSLLTPNGSDYNFYDANLGALRGKVDASLWVRATFLGAREIGAFTLTNSEVQYHDIKRKQVIAKSFERYTFYSDMVFTNLHFPITLKDRDQTDRMIPALFTTEGSGLSRGVKFKAAVRDGKDNLVEIVSPARLRFKASTGCRPLDNPTKASDGSPALDYYCGNQILRFKLSY